MKKTIFIIILVLLLGFVIFLYLGSLFTNKFIAEKVEKIETVGKTYQDSVITDLTGYPFSLRRYFSSSIKENFTPPAFAEVTVNGKLRTNEKSDWTPYEATHYYNCVIPGFVWDGWLKPQNLIWNRIIDSFEDGKANTLVKLLSSITVSDIQSGQLDQSALTRYLLESLLFPRALFPSEYLDWERFDDSTNTLEIKYKNLSAKAKCYFNSRNELYKATTSDRYKPTGVGYTEEVLTILYSDYKWYGDFKIPTAFELQWNMPEGTFAFQKFEITKILYDAKLN